MSWHPRIIAWLLPLLLGAVAAWAADPPPAPPVTVTAAVASAKAAIRSAELNVEFTHIKSAVSGRISYHQVSVGNLVAGGDNASTPALTTIVSLDPIWFYFDLSEDDFLAFERAAGRGKLGALRGNSPPAYVRLADETEWTRKGMLNFIDNQVDRGAGTIR